mmetsp:Transcript_116647/g.249406  ORF Transcript_116647/g.249406 Transcript_116647/m.249406 type:complete len:132 (+) Transcript_116647:1-396(+)
MVSASNIRPDPGLAALMADDMKKDDWPPDVEDADRVRYLRAHICAVHDAIAEGVNVKGYFVWSLMDNFEWAEGFEKRFGLIHVNYETLKRTPKASAAWYAKLIARRGLNVIGPAEIYPGLPQSESADLLLR